MKSRKYKKHIITLGIPLLILIVLIVIKIITGGSGEGNIARYVIANVKGFDTNATLTLTLDTVGLENALKGKNTTDAERSLIDEFIGTVTYEADKTDNLSNSDQIKIKVSYDREIAKKLGYKIKADTRMYKVSGLKKGKKLDAFSDIKIITGGISPYVYVNYDNESEDEYLKTLEYSIDRTSNLSIGDEITITCKANEDVAYDKGYYFESLKKVYTIEEADKYISEPEEFQKDMIKELADADFEVIVDEIEDTTEHMSYKVTQDVNYLFKDGNEKAGDFSLEKAVLAYNDSGFEREHENYLLLYFKGNIQLPTYSTTGKQYTDLECRFCFMYSDAVLLRDGSIMMATNEPEKRYVCGTDFEDVKLSVVSEIGSSYSFEDIDIQ